MEELMRAAVKATIVVGASLLLPAASCSTGADRRNRAGCPGSVLPGVLVEATSPALIEKVRQRDD